MTFLDAVGQVFTILFSPYSLMFFAVVAIIATIIALIVSFVELDWSPHIKRWQIVVWVLAIPVLLTAAAYIVWVSSFPGNYWP